MARKLAFDVAEDEVQVTLRDDGTAVLAIQGPNEQDYMSAGGVPAEAMAQELRAVADFLDGEPIGQGLPLPKDSLIDQRLRGLTDAEFRLYIGLRLLAKPESDGLVTATYGSLSDLGRLAALEEQVNSNGDPVVTHEFVRDAIRAMEAVDLVRHDEGARRLVIMR